MIICPNCGSTNDENTKVCRKCGALLPVSTKPPRLRVPFSKKEKQEEKEKKKNINEQRSKAESNGETPAEVRFFNSQNSSNNSEDLDLQEIPMDDSSADNKLNKEETQSTNVTRENSLQEIDPSPFDGSMFSSDPIERSSKPQTHPLPEGKQNQESIAKKDNRSKQLRGKQKQLEKDMREVLGFLSDKLKIPQSEIKVQTESSLQKVKVDNKEIKPESLNEILKQLLNINNQIEASALINRDGTILASAISDRISDTLFATIGQNLSMMGGDIIDGLSAGSLQSISVRGTEGVLDLAPIDPQNPNLSKMLLIIFSNPKVKSGIINIATNMVRKQVKEYLGID